MEESESWSKDNPLTKEEGLELLNKLKEKLSPKDQELRKKPFADAERFVKGAKGGVQAPLRQSFRDTKVDVEVWNGYAFVCITFLILIVLWLLK